ncbi:MAG: glycosyltransferase family A protein [Gammaproteobacteria bacterium]|nr:glycosyltransferase family A protein [Gammaproteobacteria bacterium]
MNKKISIIVAVWNGEKYIEEAINSILNQTYLNKEIIIVNDGSTDKTTDIIKKFSDKVICINQENHGLFISQNRGVKIATGDYLSFLDYDDIWENDKLSKQMELMQKEENDPIVFMRIKQFICPSLTSEDRKKIGFYEQELPGYIAGTLLISKERFNQIGFFEEKRQLGGFIEWYFRVLEKNIPTKITDAIGLHRRIHNDNMGRQLSVYSRTDYLRILKTNLVRKRTLSYER